MNVILIGMPGSGKSTAGVLAAKALCCSFLDTDLLIQGKAGRTLQSMIDADGIDRFLAFEEEAVRAIAPERTVVATGGSVVYSPAAMAHLKSLGRVLYLHLSFEEMAARLGNISTRGVVMRKGSTLREMYEERLPLYRRYADIVIDCAGKGVEETVAEIVAAVGEKGEDGA